MKKTLKTYARIKFDGFTLFTAALVLLPLPFGGNRPWASDLFAAACAILLLTVAWNAYRNPLPELRGAPKRRLLASASLITLVILWGFLQTQSWMPESWRHPIWNSVKALPEAFEGSISIDPEKSNGAIARLLSYGACFLLAFIGGRDDRRAKKMLSAVSFAAVGYAVYGLLMQSSGLQKILWFDKWAYENSVTSTFVNKNSYATYASLGFMACLALLWTRLKKAAKAMPKTTPKKIEWLENLIRKEFPFIIMPLIVLAALLLTGSRAGMASAFIGSFVFLSALAYNRRWKWTRLLPVLALGILLVVGLSSFNENAALNQIDMRAIEKDAPMRLAAYDVAVRAIMSNPWLGFGLGSFDSAFRIYRDATVKEWFQHAHNDYLEIAMELGIPAAAMLIMAILMLVSCCMDGVRNRRRKEIYPILALAASAAVGAHAFWDFSMQIPAVAATYAALLGLGVAQSWSSRAQD